MNGATASTRSEMTLLGILLATGLVLGGLVLGSQIKATRLSDRYVTVRGLAERNVKSDLAIWCLGYKDAGDDLLPLYSKSEADKKAILEFLSRQGIKPSEIEVGTVSVTDTQANEYGGGNNRNHYALRALPVLEQVQTSLIVRRQLEIEGGAARWIGKHFIRLRDLTEQFVVAGFAIVGMITLGH